MKPTLRYKVVMGNPYSGLGSCVPGECRVQYRIGEWTRAKVGGLMVFTTLVAAKRFKRVTRSRGTASSSPAAYPVDIVQCCVRRQIALPARIYQDLNMCYLSTVRLCWRGFMRAGSIMCKPLAHTEAYKEVKPIKWID